MCAEVAATAVVSHPRLSLDSPSDPRCSDAVTSALLSEGGSLRQQTSCTDATARGASNGQAVMRNVRLISSAMRLELERWNVVIREMRWELMR